MPIVVETDTFDVDDVELMFEEIAPTPAPTPVPQAPDTQPPSVNAGLALTALVDQMTTALRARVAEEVAALNAALGAAKAEQTRLLRIAEEWREYGARAVLEKQAALRRVQHLEAQLSVAREETDTLISRIRRVAPPAETFETGGGI